ncbi:hypothetical protein ERX46_02230 [Brumimicrobium glaciale]|uniref:Uncharacterized protein n=1 Tax=Brumimicrobium glaciale TaxID=200475 RepID=A0A4Q4KUL5_9FLAO|nr:hypothetical protein [Brumimicrobium glaciale]RYM35834.1 hypothetical protein ERX46_02230 [Brumimicrobium glaciale]
MWVVFEFCRVMGGKGREFLKCGVVILDCGRVILFCGGIILNCGGTFWIVVVHFFPVEAQCIAPPLEKNDDHNLKSKHFGYLNGN